MHQIDLHTAQKHLLEDMHRAGVTDFLLEQAYGITPPIEPSAKSVSKSISKSIREPITKPPKPFTEPSVPVLKPNSTAVTKGALNNASKQQMHAPQVDALKSVPTIKLEDAVEVSIHKGNYPLVLVLQGSAQERVQKSAEDGQNTPKGKTNDLSPEEHTLLGNMLQAIGLEYGTDGEKVPSTLTITEKPSMEGALSMGVDMRILHTHLCSKVTELTPQPKAVFALGTQIFEACLGKDGSFINRDVEKMQKDMPLIGTYSLKALLRQSALKRQAWADLLKLKKALNV